MVMVVIKNKKTEIPGKVSGSQWPSHARNSFAPCIVLFQYWMDVKCWINVGTFALVFLATANVASGSESRFYIIDRGQVVRESASTLQLMQPTCIQCNSASAGFCSGSSLASLQARGLKIGVAFAFGSEQDWTTLNKLCLDLPKCKCC
jgi:hypothetical protein